MYHLLVSYGIAKEEEIGEGFQLGEAGEGGHANGAKGDAGGGAAAEGEGAASKSWSKGSKGMKDKGE